MQFQQQKKWTIKDSQALSRAFQVVAFEIDLLPSVYPERHNDLIHCCISPPKPSARLSSDMGLPRLHMALPLMTVCFICMGFTYSDVISIK